MAIEKNTEYVLTANFQKLFSNGLPAHDTERKRPPVCVLVVLVQ